MGLGLIPTTRKVLRQTGFSIEDVDVIELMERRNARCGLATRCIGGGQRMVMIIIRSNKVNGLPMALNLLIKGVANPRVTTT